MSRLFHRSSPAASRKVMLATGCYGNMEPAYAYALAESVGALKDSGIACEVAILAGDCHVDHARNRLIRLFLKGDCTDLVFIDADIRWQGRDLVSLLTPERDVIAGVYPMKKDDEEFPVKMLPGEIWSDALGLIEVDGVPAGFLRIKRHVLEFLAEAAAKFRHPGDDSPTAMIFERTLDGERLWGGDYAFCRKWRASGGRIYVDPRLALEHNGTKAWSGSLASHLRRKNGVALTQCLDAIRAGKETPELLNDMIAEWGNPWAATTEILTATIMLARAATGPILECGTGLTTLVMGAANPNVPIHCLESDHGWHSKVYGVVRGQGMDNVTIHCAQLRDGWYDVPAGVPNHFALAIVDGPPKCDDRLGVLRSNLSAETYLFDDIEDRAEFQRNIWPAHFFGKKRLFAIVPKGWTALAA